MGRRPKIKQEISKVAKFQKYKTPSLLRGFRDVLANEHLYLDFINKKIKDITRKYSYKKIDIPALEEKTLFQRALGRKSDIVSKELMCFADQGNCNVCLRPEPMAPLARAYLKHGMFNSSQPVKLYHTGSMYRYEKPQSGRYREFHQFTMAALGNDNKY